jgi:predicted phosphoribosyltransferase/dienelactone hydrolase
VTRFLNRADAGRQLASHLSHLVREDPLVLAVPRGGVPVAAQVAEELGLPLDVIIVRKLGLAHQPELAMGAVGEDGVRVLHDDVLRAARVKARELAEAERRERAEVDARSRRFRGSRGAASLSGRVVIIVDDGIATGSTMRAACAVARARGARRVVVAVPVAASDSLVQVGQEADEIVCLFSPTPFTSVGQWYAEFDQVADDDVLLMLEAAHARHRPGVAGAGSSRRAEVHVPVTGPLLPGVLTVPEHATGVVVFAHGSGSGRFSPRNRYVADRLNDADLGTFLVDLLTPDEEGLRENVFDVELLASRVCDTVSWLAAEPATRGLPVGLFGASTGAAAALAAAATSSVPIAAVVSRGGRPDLAERWLPRVQAPTLLIVGGRDRVVLGLNERAERMLDCPRALAVVRGAGHLFEEPGALSEVARLAVGWFEKHLGSARS